MMLEIKTNEGNFGRFKDVLLFMQEENLKQIEILELKYCCSPVFGKGIYTIDEIKYIINNDEGLEEVAFTKED